MGLATVAEACNIANSIGDAPAFSLTSISIDRAPIKSHSGMTLQPDRCFSESDQYDWVIICGSSGSAQFDHPGVLSWLRRLDRRGVLLGAITSGTWILARAGLLHGTRCTIHWQDAPAFREAFPELPLTDALYEIDQRRITCAGGSGALDMIVHLIAAHQNSHMANQVNQRMVNDRIRPRETVPEGSLSAQSTIPNQLVARAVRFMETHIEDPITVRQLAELCDVSPRHLARLFQTHLSQTPQAHYLRVRLAQAKVLLEDTDLPIGEVALASGFQSAHSFGQAFKTRYRLTPSAQRRSKQPS
jgi:AraC family carnitine catabolism transcriptional activator